MKCGVNAWTACKHRPAEPVVERPEIRDDKRNGSRAGNGYNFHKNKRKRLKS